MRGRSLRKSRRGQRYPAPPHNRKTGTHPTHSAAHLQRQECPQRYVGANQGTLRLLTEPAGARWRLLGTNHSSKITVRITNTRSVQQRHIRSPSIVPLSLDFNRPYILDAFHKGKNRLNMRIYPRGICIRRCNPCSSSTLIDPSSTISHARHKEGAPCRLTPTRENTFLSVVGIYRLPSRERMQSA